jgi:hypothetical protein
MFSDTYSRKITLNAISLGIMLPLILAFYLYPHNLSFFRSFFIKVFFILIIGYISFDIFTSTKNLNVPNMITCKSLMYIFSFLLLLLAIQVLFTNNSSSH